MKIPNVSGSSCMSGRELWCWNGAQVMHHDQLFPSFALFPHSPATHLHQPPPRCRLSVAVVTPTTATGLLPSPVLFPHSHLVINRRRLFTSRRHQSQPLPPRASPAAIAPSQSTTAIATLPFQ
ncbi:hypothetical protein Droror1_Dr00015798 [Drosera rotundifolia]